MNSLLTKLLLASASLLALSERPMRCYQCNSAEDANCDSSDAKDLRQYIKLCPILQGGTYDGTEPIACRKIIQSVEELPTRTIRECAYTGDKQLDGLRKQGNKAIKLLYYQCENIDGETPCNDAQMWTTGYATLTSTLIFSIIAVLRI